eukprot:gene8580-10166_t
MGIKGKSTTGSNKRPKLVSSHGGASKLTTKQQAAAKGKAASESDEGSDDDDEEEEDGSDDDSESEGEEQDLAQMFFFYAKGLVESGETKNFPKAMAALVKVKGIIVQRNAELKKLIDKALKRDEKDNRVPPGSNLVQRTLKDDRFFMCTTNVLISKLLLASGNSRGAQLSLREALICFPRSIEGGYLMAEILRCNATSEESLLQAEALLQKAIETGTHLKTKFKETTQAVKAAKLEKAPSAGASEKADAGATRKYAHGNTEENDETEEDSGELTEIEQILEIEAEELSAATKAQEILILLLLQQGKFDASYPHLVRQNFKWRLSKEVFNYPVASETNTSSQALKNTAGTAENPICKAFDQFVAPSVVAHLQHVFRPDSPYWSEHNYDTVINASSTAGYFSYLYPLKERAPKCSVEQIIFNTIFPVVCEQFPQAAEANYAEWWVHSRPHSNGHQLHFDSDETRIMSGRTPQHPLVSTVLYLSDEIGGPTVVTNQRLAGPLATEGYMVLPKSNRCVMFDAQYLHGVIPGRGVNSSPHSNARRLTFMVGFWKDIAAKDRGLDVAGPGQPFPSNKSKYTWPKEMKSEGDTSSVFAISGAAAGGVKSTTGSAVAAEAVPVQPIHLNAIWEPIECDVSREVSGVDASVSASVKVPSTVAATPHYSACFQGF